jgi:hypothetical protein
MSNPFEEEYGETVRNFRLEAERGQAYAQFSLGLFYHTGLPGMPQDHVEAARLWRLGAAQGHVLAQYHGSRLYSEGKGVPLDHVEAARLLGLAAAQGHQEAQFELGCLYVQGKGVPQDPAEAGRLWWLAAAQGEDDAREGLKNSVVHARVRRRVLHGLRRDAQAQDVHQVQGGALLRRGVPAAGVGRAQAALQDLEGGRSSGAVTALLYAEAVSWRAGRFNIEAAVRSARRARGPISTDSSSPPNASLTVQIAATYAHRRRAGARRQS